MRRDAAVILGAGPTGLSAAYHLGESSLLLERESWIGGGCRSIESGGFTFDMAGHIMYSNDPYVHELYDRLLGDNVHWQDREAWVYSQGVHTRYPFQGALHGLPPETIRECILGAIEARYGDWRRPLAHAEHARPNGNGRAATRGQLYSGRTNGSGGMTAGRHERSTSGASQSCDRLHDGYADGMLEAEPPRAATDDEPHNFEEFIYRVWGAGIAKHFAIPYNRKLWTVPLAAMETSWLKGRVPLPDLGEMIEGALSAVPRPMGPNARFGYPLRGGFQALMDGFVPLLRGKLRLDSEVTGVDPGRRLVLLRDGTSIHYEALISTLPLPQLIRRIAHVPPAVREAAEGLKHVSVRCVHLGIGRPHLTEKHWIYYPGDTVFHRIFVQGNASPACNPPGGCGLTCEISYSRAKPLPCDGDALIQRCVADARSVGMIREDDPVWTATQVDLPYAYVVYDHARASRVAHIRAWLLEHGIVLAGPYSEWDYYNSDHAFLAGRKAAQTVEAILGGAHGAATETAA